MLRQHLMKQASPDPAAFRWRGGDVSRIEGFSDAVFGFAITLLVVSLEVPRTFDDLTATMRGFGGFAVCFTLLSVVWYDHYAFFRQYGLNDTWTVVLNLILLFLVMFYVYPLKFLFTIIVHLFTGLGGGKNMPAIHPNQFPQLMLIYGAGFVAIYTVFSLMWLNAYRQRDALELNEIERFDTRSVIWCYLVLIAIGLISILIAWFGGSRWVFISGMTYWGIGPAMAVFWTINGKRRRPLEARMRAESNS